MSRKILSVHFWVHGLIIRHMAYEIKHIVTFGTRVLLERAW